MDSLAETTKNQVVLKEEEEEEEEHFSYAMQLVTSAAQPMVLLAAIRLDVFEIIARAGPGAQLSPSEIAANVSSENPNATAMLDRMLRLLASYSVLTCSVATDVDGDHDIQTPTRVYGLAPVAKFFVQNKTKGGGSLGSVLGLLQDKVFIDSWYQLEDALRKGGDPFHRAHGTHAFEFLGSDPRFNEVFNKAMIHHTAIVINRMLERYKGFEHLKTLVDVGGGLGMNLNIITTKYPSLKGINFDLPHVIQHAPAYPGVEHVGGDMFESVPQGDAIFMKWILHDWDDDHCLKLLKNCYKALPDNGKVIAVDAILPVIPDDSARDKATCQADLIVVTQYKGGIERYETEFLALATAAGFKGISVKCFVCNLWVMEFYK
ncbi:caffeic acid 3-O-methyltransferase-like isoform X2 [Coffea arabica]|uniref:Caffeic acid 3-O-methyltransferase-like isoform X2 n=1 Tax=Coffea arabica TaxID=13443 RepID=A0ABM4UAS6_COFAR